MDNFLATGFEEAIKGQREKGAQEKAELQTIASALGKEFPQKAELELTRENHAAVIRELQRMQDDENYVSEWKPKTLENSVQQPVDAEAVQKSQSNIEIPCWPRTHTLA